MSATLNYQEPYHFSAGVLALAVHLALFALLYFGVRWQSHPPEEFMVEMWDSLPNSELVPEHEPPPPAKMEPSPPPKVVAPVLPPVKADIEVHDKKSKKAEVKEKPPKNDKAKVAARQEADRKELEDYEARAAKKEQERVRDVRAQIRAETSAATRVQVERYTDKIRSKIRSKMKAVPDVPESAEAIFKITLLPDGSLLDDPVLLKSSGIPAYDNAAARAILLAQPLPMPTDISLQREFRELRLSIRP